MDTQEKSLGPTARELKSADVAPDLRDICREVEGLKASLSQMKASLGRPCDSVRLNMPKEQVRESLPEYVGGVVLYWMLEHSLEKSKTPMERIDHIKALLAVVVDAIHVYGSINIEDAYPYSEHESMAGFFGDRILLGLLQQGQVSSIMLDASTLDTLKLEFMLKVMDDALEDYRSGRIGCSPQVNMSGMFKSHYLPPLPPVTGKMSESKKVKRSIAKKKVKRTSSAKRTKK